MYSVWIVTLTLVASACVGTQYKNMRSGVPTDSFASTPALGFSESETQPLAALCTASRSESSRVEIGIFRNVDDQTLANIAVRDVQYVLVRDENSASRGTWSPKVSERLTIRDANFQLLDNGGFVVSGGQATAQTGEQLFATGADAKLFERSSDGNAWIQKLSENGDLTVSCELKL